MNDDEFIEWCMQKDGNVDWTSVCVLIGMLDQNNLDKTFAAVAALKLVAKNHWNSKLIHG